jgi:ATP-dependent Clp protease ATP-binding subunit ClpC
LGDPSPVLQGFGITLERGREWFEDRGVRGQWGRSIARPQFTLRAKKALELALREAKIIRQERMGTDHILMELLREGEESAMRVLSDLEVLPEMVRRQLLRMRDADRST